jgi:hypothetical protein
MVLDAEVISNGADVLHEAASERFSAHRARIPRPDARAAGLTSRTRSRWTGLVFVVTVLLASACTRKAPGPDECHAFAVRVAQLQGIAVRPLPRSDFEPEPTDQEQAQQDEDELSDPIMSLTTECITTPFDREVVSCVLSAKASPRACFRAFAARHGGTSDLLRDRIR